MQQYAEIVDDKCRVFLKLAPSAGKKETINILRRSADLVTLHLLFIKKEILQSARGRCRIPSSAMEHFKH